MKKILAIMALFVSLVFGAVDLNTASKQELMGISGIGEKKADAIIEYRSKTPFKSIDDLKNVKGFGGKLFDKVKNEVSVNGTKATEAKKSTEAKESKAKDSKAKDSKKSSKKKDHKTDKSKKSTKDSKKSKESKDTSKDTQENKASSETQQ